MLSTTKSIVMVRGTCVHWRDRGHEVLVCGGTSVKMAQKKEARLHELNPETGRGKKNTLTRKLLAAATSYPASTRGSAGATAVSARSASIRAATFTAAEAARTSRVAVAARVPRRIHALAAAASTAEAAASFADNRRADFDGLTTRFRTGAAARPFAAAPGCATAVRIS